MPASYQPAPHEGQRLRVLDLHTPLFWFTIFYEPWAYGESWLKIEVWAPHAWGRYWLHLWHWEDIPSGLGHEGDTLTEKELKS